MPWGTTCWLRPASSYDILNSLITAPTSASFLNRKVIRPLCARIWWGSAFYGKAFGWNFDQFPGFEYWSAVTTASDKNGTPTTPGSIYSKDLMLNPDFGEMITQGPGWGAIIPEESPITSDDFRKHYGEGYRRAKDGGWVPSEARGHEKIREKTA